MSVSTLGPGGREDRVSPCLKRVQVDVRRGSLVSTLGPGGREERVPRVYTGSRGT